MGKVPNKKDLQKMRKKMTYPGTDKKYMLESMLPDFRPSEDEFEIVVRDQYHRERYRIPKQDCFWDSDGRYYFTLENVRAGAYYAVFTGSYEDDDYDKQRRVFTDVQPLLEVGYVRCPSGCRHKPDGCSCHAVRYTEVTAVSIDGDDYLCGSDGKYILTSDGKRICFKSDKRKQIEDMGKVILDTMTGDEFKKFIEGRNPDGDIDTVPEMIDALKGISDDETVQQDVDELPCPTQHGYRPLQRRFAFPPDRD